MRRTIPVRGNYSEEIDRLINALEARRHDEALRLITELGGRRIWIPPGVMRRRRILEAVRKMTAAGMERHHVIAAIRIRFSLPSSVAYRFFKRASENAVRP